MDFYLIKLIFFSSKNENLKIKGICIYAYVIYTKIVKYAAQMRRLTSAFYNLNESKVDFPIFSGYFVHWLCIQKYENVGKPFANNS